MCKWIYYRYTLCPRRASREPFCATPCAAAIDPSNPITIGWSCPNNTFRTVDIHSGCTWRRGERGVRCERCLRRSGELDPHDELFEYLIDDDEGLAENMEWWIEHVEERDPGMWSEVNWNGTGSAGVKKRKRDDESIVRGAEPLSPISKPPSVDHGDQPTKRSTIVDISSA